MKEYKFVENSQNCEKTVETLNELATAGWYVVGFSELQVLLERDKVHEEEQHLLQD